MSNIAKGVWIYNLDGTLFGQFRTQKEALISMGISHRHLHDKVTIHRKWVVSFMEGFPGTRIRKNSKRGGLLNTMRQYISSLTSPMTIKDIQKSFPVHLTLRKIYGPIHTLFGNGEIGRVKLSLKGYDHAYGPLWVTSKWNQPLRDNVVMFDIKDGVFVSFPTIQAAASQFGVREEYIRHSKTHNCLVRERYVHDPNNLPRKLLRRNRVIPNGEPMDEGPKEKVSKG